MQNNTNLSFVEIRKLVHYLKQDSKAANRAINFVTQSLSVGL
ncbi:MAG: hypothetical protein V7784_01965 [Oceanospirillaceae bacterium]